MTLNTEVQVLTEVDPHEVFHKCRELLGATSVHPFEDKPDSWRGEGARTIANPPGIGLPAWLICHYREDTPLRTPEQAATHDEDCEDDCDGTGWSHSPAAWMEVTMDTGYGYSDDEGGCGALHARLVARLGKWLDARGVEWSWTNEFTGETHAGDQRYDRLPDLAGGGEDAERWFHTSILPAIAEATGIEP